MKTIMICSLVLILAAFAGISWGGTEGNMNTFYGKGAGNSTTGDDDYDTFIGANAGYSNTTGYVNSFLGYNAGYSNTTGLGDTFLGFNAGYSNTTGYANTCLGAYACWKNTTGYWNTFLGEAAGRSNTTGYYNTYLGLGAGYYNTTGTGNVFLGNFAGQNEAGSNRLYIANTNTTTPLLYGEFDNKILSINGNVGIGTQKPKYPLQMAGGAYTDGKTWVDVSSREYKEDIEELSAGEARQVMRELNPVKYTFKADRTERRVGFVSEEVPELVSMKDRRGLSAMEIVAVLTKVVQEQQKTISVLTEELNELKKEMGAKRIEALSAPSLSDGQN